ncbi:hypothetical protein Q4610_01010 [Sphingobium sp. HBC34]|uniref:Uncharacterized protein n=1 Tax=Sphingobium cyanobacteriorum TaxID=3063954 RepID=A0ABT8ZH08_9SPHN|nr:hypothetical protein [Sphingobium sp. HBC34]MDO7833613.1 hypothetical protein [Sphingobium sp. HBC34]
MKVTKNLLLTLAGMVIVIPLAKYVGRVSGEVANGSELPRKELASVSDIQTLVSRQDAEGVTDADMSPEFLKNLEAWTLERVKLKAKPHWDAAGVPQEQRAVTAESVYVSTASHKLAVTRLRMGQTTPQAMIFGIVGTEAVRVLCMNSNGDDVPVASGPCDEKLREVFGESINPLVTT